MQKPLSLVYTPEMILISGFSAPFSPPAHNLAFLYIKSTPFKTDFTKCLMNIFTSKTAWLRFTSFDYLVIIRCQIYLFRFLVGLQHLLLFVVSIWCNYVYPASLGNLLCRERWNSRIHQKIIEIVFCSLGTNKNILFPCKWNPCRLIRWFPAL